MALEDLIGKTITHAEAIHYGDDGIGPYAKAVEVELADARENLRRDMARQTWRIT